MRKVALIVFILSAHIGFSQSVPRLVEFAEAHFEAHQYLEAIEYYEKIVSIDKQNIEARYKLAICYQQTLQYDKAEMAFIALGNRPDHPFRARSLYYYATLRMHDSAYEEADSVYNVLISMPDASPELVDLSRNHKEGCLLAIRQKKLDRGFKVDVLEGINSRFHDFGAVVNPANLHLVFATTRNLPGEQFEGSQYDGLLPDLAAYEHRRNNRWVYAGGDQNFDNINTHWAEGSGSFTADGKKFYFSSCLGEAASDCSIFVSYLEKDKWTKPVALNEYINEPGSENKHPYITSSGDTLFFSSDRPGGAGGEDIWMSLTGAYAESWSPAINLGKTINSSENEITPYYSEVFSCLVFASDGHVGYGGFDLYAAKGKSFFEPHVYNLGAPFNSTWDDTYFNISDSVGFLTTNRLNGKILDLFSFPVSDEKLFLSLLISGESLIDARIMSNLRDTRSIDIVTLRVEDYQGYELYEAIDFEKSKPDLIVERLMGVQKRKGNSAAMGTAGADDVTNADPDAGKPTTADMRTAQRMLTGPIIGAAGYAGKKSEPSTDQSFEKILFDFGDATLRSEGKVALVNLVTDVDINTISKISLFGYADNLGGEEYNMNLCRDRGNSVKAFLTALGVPAEKIFVYPRGELTPDGEIDHWFKRILRRRVEVQVETTTPVSLTLASTYILRKPGTVHEIASQLGYELSTLIAWNGNPKKPLQKGSTIRVYEPAPNPPNMTYFITEENLFDFLHKVELNAPPLEVFRD
jgi:outer membrane protein OmpA-like peptidoglycan-associated protein/tetratricopeptide (TPR) repeat protein